VKPGETFKKSFARGSFRKNLSGRLFELSKVLISYFIVYIEDLLKVSGKFPVVVWGNDF